MRRVMLSLLASASVAIVSLMAQSPPPAKDSVRLGFCWAPGMKAEVTASSMRTQTNAPTRGGTIRYTLDVSEHGEHLLIRTLNPVADLSLSKTPVSPIAQAQIDDRLDELLPDYLVTKAGKFAGLVDLPGYQARLRALIEKSLPPKVDRASIQKGLEMATSEAALNTRVAQEWNVLVTAWAGATLPIGVEQTRQARVGAPGKPAVTITHTYSASRRVPCRRGGADRQCVQLDLHSVPDGDAIKTQIAAMVAAIGGATAPAHAIRSMSIDEHVQLVTEIDCLIPHSFTRTRTQKAVAMNDGKEQAAERSDRTAVTYVFN